MKHCSSEGQWTVCSLWGPHFFAEEVEKLHNNTLNNIFLHSQGLISRTKDFGDAYKLIRSKLAGLRDRLVAADGCQPDILAKKSQSDQFRVSLIPGQTRLSYQNVCWNARSSVYTILSQASADLPVEFR